MTIAGYNDFKLFVQLRQPALKNGISLYVCRIERAHRLQEYIDEFVHCSNRHYWEEQIPNRLLALLVGAGGKAWRGKGV